MLEIAQESSLKILYIIYSHVPPFKTFKLIRLTNILHRDVHVAHNSLIRNVYYYFIEKQNIYKIY